MSLNRKIRIVCRNSPLSLLQVQEIVSLFPRFDFEQHAFSSYGDKNKQLSLMDNIASDFFTRELDEMLLSGQADISIHSAKDLPYPLPPGLELFCLTEGKDKSDSLISKENLPFAELPANSRIGTSSKTRKEELFKLRSDLQITSIRGTIEERIALVDNGTIDALIVATCALERLGLSHRIAERLPFKTHPLQGNLAIVGKKGDKELKDFFSTLDIHKNYGRVTLVGFGPGNADLLTIGGDKALSKADVILHDDLLDKDFLDKYPAQKVYVGKRSGHHSCDQDEINEMIYQYAAAGNNVVRLKGGDPMIFAHGREEIDFLQSRFVEVDVIPGVTTALALSAYTHIPLTHRSIASSVAFVTGHSVANLDHVKADTLVIYMGGSHVDELAGRLIENGRNPETPVALVHNVSLPEQQTFFSSLKELKNMIYKFPTPILIIVGEVVSFEKNRISVPKVLVTGTTATEYTEAGRIVHTPLIKVQKNEDAGIKKMLSEEVGKSDWIIFTSRYGVRYFFDILSELQIDSRAFAQAKIASVGKTTTAELKNFHLFPEVESASESAEGLISYFQSVNETEKNILLPRSDKGLRFLSDELEKLGNRVADIPVYKNTVNEAAEIVDLSEFQKIIFSSPSCVDAFVKLYGKLPENIQLIARGKTTENKLKETIQ